MAYQLILSSDTLDIGRQKINSFMQSAVGVWSADTPNYSVISLQGSNLNQADGNYSFVTGKNNTANTGNFQVITGGYNNRGTGTFTSILGGTNNIQTNDLGKYNAIINGKGNSIIETDVGGSGIRRSYNTVINGTNISIDGNRNISAGESNTIAGNSNVVIGSSLVVGKNTSFNTPTQKGPQYNEIKGNNSGIVGGENWYFNSIHGDGNSISATTGNFVDNVHIRGTGNRVIGPGLGNVHFFGDYLTNNVGGSPVGRLMMFGSGLNLANPLAPSSSFFGQFIMGVNGARRCRIMFTTLDNNAYLSSGSWQGSGADYGEYFEWLDGNPSNEQRTGFFVELIDGKIRKAQTENVLGIISKSASFIGDSHQDYWKNRVIRDEWGTPLIEKFEKYYFLENNEKKEIFFDENGNSYNSLPFVKDKNSLKVAVSKENCTFAETVYSEIMNPNFDPDVEYIPRNERKEWSVVGLLGKIRVRTKEQISGNAVDVDTETGMAKNGTKYQIIEKNKDFDGNYGIVTIFFK